MSMEQELMRQATVRAHEYMSRAKSDVHKLFGEPFASTHGAALIAAYMQVAAADFNNTHMAQVVGQGLETLAEGICEDKEEWQ